MRILLSAFALAAAVSASPLSAEDTVTVRVEIAGLDLASAEGRAALEARITAEAREACTLSDNSRYRYGRDLVDNKCVAEARAAAMAEVDQMVAANARGEQGVAAS